ncbi:hypothetical protein L596_025448 [Steinernema carpocapsae]|uniref:Uncharacterized protein n=1 Tax=Steinernema carpocapsae TaxID=34508 RepID=A0A4U5M8M9_STECR|nr:hypothetical protein L596_025448 [Steinernema carpocapsae]
MESGRSGLIRLSPLLPDRSRLRLTTMQQRAAKCLWFLRGCDVALTSVIFVFLLLAWEAPTLCKLPTTLDDSNATTPEALNAFEEGEKANNTTGVKARGEFYDDWFYAVGLLMISSITSVVATFRTFVQHRQTKMSAALTLLSVTMLAFFGIALYSLETRIKANDCAHFPSIWTHNWYLVGALGLVKIFLMGLEMNVIGQQDTDSEQESAEASTEEGTGTTQEASAEPLTYPTKVYKMDETESDSMSAENPSLRGASSHYIWSATNNSNTAATEHFEFQGFGGIKIRSSPSLSSLCSKKSSSSC